MVEGVSDCLVSFCYRKGLCAAIHMNPGQGPLAKFLILIHLHTPIKKKLLRKENTRQILLTPHLLSSIAFIHRLLRFGR